jgi:hypothetical protein
MVVKKLSAIHWTGIGVVTVIVGGLIFGPKTTSPQEPRCGSQAEAWTYGTDRVSEALKNPADASYPWGFTPYVKLTDAATCKWTVTAYVDATNSFGAKLRTHFEIVVQHKPDGWYTGRPLFNQ